MTRIALVFTAHVPWRLRRYNYFDVGRHHDYFDREAHRRGIAALDAESLAPAAAALEAALDRHPRLAFALSFSGPLLQQLVLWAPPRVAAFRRLVETGRVEPLGQTSHRSLGWSPSPAELDLQVRAHCELLERHLGRRPRVFGGEDAAAPAGLAASLEAQKFLGRFEVEAATLRALEADAVGGGADRAAWLSESADEILPVRVDLATQRTSRTGVSPADLERWLARVAARPGVYFATPSEVFPTRTGTDSVAPAEASPPENELQRDARSRLASLEPLVRAERPSDADAPEDWRRLTGSDHFAAMSLASARRADPSAFSPYEEYMAFRHAVSDLERRLAGAGSRRVPELRLPA